MLVGDDVAVRADDDAGTLALLTAEDALLVLDVADNADGGRQYLLRPLGDGQLPFREVNRCAGIAGGRFVVQDQRGGGLVLLVCALGCGLSRLLILLVGNQRIGSVACQADNAHAQNGAHDARKDLQAFIFLLAGMLAFRLRGLLIILIVPFIMFAGLGAVRAVLRLLPLLGSGLPVAVPAAVGRVLVLILACLLVALLRTGAVPALLVWLLGCSALILLVCSRNIFIRKDPAAAAFRAACILLRVLLRCAGLIVDIFLRVLIFLWGLAACFKFLFIHIEKPPCIRSAKHLCRMIDVFGFHDFYYTGNL